MKVSIVISVCNEEESIFRLWVTLNGILSRIPGNKEVLFVDDGSRDASLERIRGLKSDMVDTEIRSLSFIRNYGHESAMKAGCEHATGDVLICMDADLQHPPADIPKILASIEAGADAVFMVRERREDASWLRRTFTSLFYRLVRRMSGTPLEQNATDYFAIRRELWNDVSERYAGKLYFLRAVLQMNSVHPVFLPFVAPSRQEGESKYSMFRLFSLSFNVIAHYTHIPLRLAIIFSLVYATVGILLAGYSVVKWIGSAIPTGYTTIIVFMALSFSFLFLVLGIMGYYISVLIRAMSRDPEFILRRENPEV